MLPLNILRDIKGLQMKSKTALSTNSNLFYRCCKIIHRSNSSTKNALDFALAFAVERGL